MPSHLRLAPLLGGLLSLWPAFALATQQLKKVRVAHEFSTVVREAGINLRIEHPLQASCRHRS